MTERALILGDQQKLIGVLTIPGELVVARPAVLLLNAGVIHHVGPARLYVELARELAARGFLICRFDFSGIGDSPPRADQLPFEQSMVLETRAAMDELQRRFGIARFCLMGLCDGAVAAFKTACVDERAGAIVLMNARGFDNDPAWNEYILSQGRARDLRARLFSPRAWLRLLTGASQYRHIVRVLLSQLLGLGGPRGTAKKVVSNLGTAAQALVARHVRVLLLNSAGDHSLDYIRAILGATRRQAEFAHLFAELAIHDADHTLTFGQNRRDAIAGIRDWLDGSMELDDGKRAAS